MTTRGMLLGKFMPPHAGHRMLVDFARPWVDELTVLFYSRESDEIPAALRYAWMQELCVGTDLRHITDNIPHYPDESPDFWPIWTEHLRRQFPDGLDYVFGSEDYCFQVAEILGARYIPVDHARELIPARGTEIRADPMEHWEHIPDCVRPYYVKRVCLFGPESTGKSSLAEQLAIHYDTVAAYEYARRLLDFKDGRCDQEDIVTIARGQAASEDALARHANRVLVCDTDALATQLWSELLFKSCPDEVADLAESRTYDMYFLMDVDMPWVDDGQRFFGGNRAEIFEHFRNALISRDRRYLRLDGDYDTRFRIACDAIDILIGRPTGRPPHPQLMG